MPQILRFTRIKSSRYSQSPIPGAPISAGKQVSLGEDYEISGLADSVLIDRLEGLNVKNRILWIEDEEEGHKAHALMEVQGNRTVETSQHSYVVRLFLRENVCESLLVDEKIVDSNIVDKAWIADPMIVA